MAPRLADFQRSEARPGSDRTLDLGPRRGTGSVEPVDLQRLCATRYGEKVGPGLVARIRERDPDDEGVGLRVGELRGLFGAVVEGDPAR